MHWTSWVSFTFSTSSQLFIFTVMSNVKSKSWVQLTTIVLEQCLGSNWNSPRAYRVSNVSSTHVQFSLRSVSKLCPAQTVYMVYNRCSLPISKLIKLPSHDTTCNAFHVEVKAMSHVKEPLELLSLFGVISWKPTQRSCIMLLEPQKSYLFTYLSENDEEKYFLKRVSSIRRVKD